MKNWIFFALFLTGCTPIHTFYQLEQRVTTTHPPSCEVILHPPERAVENTEKNNKNLKCSINRNEIHDINKGETFNLFINENPHLRFITPIAFDPLYLAILNYNLDKNKKDNPKESTTIEKRIKELIVASVPFLIFLWGLTTSKLSEARAKVALLIPLMEKASDAIKSADENFKSNGVVTLEDIHKFTIPMIGLEKLLEDHSLTDYFLEQNNDAFQYIKWLMPPNILMEIRNKDLFYKFRLSMLSTASASNPQQTINAISLIDSHYKTINEYIFAEKRPNFLMKKFFAYLLYISTLLGGFILYLLLVAFF